MIDYRKRANNVLKRINSLAAISEQEKAITRTFGSTAFIEASRKIALWMLEAGLDTRIDSIGNVRGKLSSENPDAKTFVIASHFDSVINAGKFDGPLGIIAGLDLLENLIDTQTKIPFDIELVAFSDEEGVRFHTTYLGSKVLAGSFESAMLDFKDSSGILLRQVLKEMNSNVSQIKDEAIPRDKWLGYFEIHIEQGPVLDERSIPVGVVTGIAGQKRVEITFEGFAGHAGTVPMNLRQDALCCASEFVLLVEDYGKTHSENLVATVGKLEVQNAASNVIPGRVICSLDLRSSNKDFLETAYTELHTKLENLAAKRNVKTEWKLIQHTNPVTCNNQLKELLSKSIEKLNFPLIELVSGAGHDAVPVSEVAPVSMLFVRCDKGISHNPLENTGLDDIAAALEVSENFIQSLIKINQN